jgi:hypothetical protein
MPRGLIDRCQVDSIAEFWAAAAQRFRDAEAAARAGRRTGAIYLWGYVAEMTLKSAYFRAVGFAENDPVTLQHRRQAEVEARQQHFTTAGRSFPHDPLAWAQLLVWKRASRPGWAYPDPRFGIAVRARAVEIQTLWAESLRYHKNIAYPFEVSRVRAAVTWLFERSLYL